MATIKNPLEFYASFDTREELEAELAKREEISEYNKKNDASWGDTFDRWFDRRLFQGAKSNAQEKRVPFTLTKDNIIRMWELQEGRCAISNQPMTWGQKCITRVSVDQILPSKGYHLHNVWLVCYGMNTLKMESSIFDLVKVYPEALKNPRFLTVYNDLLRGIQPTHNNSILPTNIESTF